MQTRTYPGLIVTERSCQEFIDALKEAPHARNAVTHADLTNRIASLTEGVAHSRAGLSKFFARGWADGATKIGTQTRDMVGEVPTAQSRRRKRVNGPDGSDLQIDRALRGDWDRAWRTSKRVWQSSPTAVDVFAIWNAAGMSQEELFWQGAAAMVLTDVLEDAGYSVRLIACSLKMFKDAKRLVLQRITVKEADAPTNPDMLASLLAHSAGTTAARWTVDCLLPFTVPEGFGAPRDWYMVRNELARQGEYPDPDTSVLLDSSYSQEAATHNVRAVLQKYQPATQE